MTIFLIVGGFSIYALVLFQRTATLQQFEAMAKTLTSTILHSLTTTMINNNPREMKQIIGHVEQEPIHRVTIYAPDGRVWASSRGGGGGVHHPPPPPPTWARRRGTPRGGNVGPEPRWPPMTN